MPLPLVAWGVIGAGVLMLGAGGAGGSYVFLRNTSEGLEEGLKMAVPVAAGALVVYAAYQYQKAR